MRGLIAPQNLSGRLPHGRNARRMDERLIFKVCNCKLFVIFSCGLIVCLCCGGFVLKITQVPAFIVHPYLSKPPLVSLVPANTLVYRGGSFARLSSVLRVLPPRRHPQIRLAIIQPVMIDMVHHQPAPDLYNLPVHPDELFVWGFAEPLRNA